MRESSFAVYTRRLRCNEALAAYELADRVGFVSHAFSEDSGGANRNNNLWESNQKYEAIHDAPRAQHPTDWSGQAEKLYERRCEGMGLPEARSRAEAVANDGELMIFVQARNLAEDCLYCLGEVLELKDWPAKGNEDVIRVRLQGLIDVCDEMIKALNAVEARLLWAVTTINCALPNVQGIVGPSAHHVALTIGQLALGTIFIRWGRFATEEIDCAIGRWAQTRKKIRSIPFTGADFDYLYSMIARECAVAMNSPVSATKDAANDFPQNRQPASNGVDDLVTLDEAAAIVHRTKRALENYLAKMPAPYIQGGGGKASLWKWDELRPWLEKQFVPDLPKRFPRNRR